MGVIRIQKNSNYVVMSKVGLHDDRLSWKAKGLLAYMLSMPNDWKFYDDELEKHAKDGKDALKSAIKELKQYGYMRRERRHNEQGKFEWETVVYEEPYTEKPSMEKPSMEKPSMEKPSMEKPSTEKPSMEKPSMEKPSTENPSLLNNKELNNNLLSNKEINDDDIGDAHAQSFQLIANRYIQRRGKGLSLSPKDETAIEKLLQEQIPLDDILKLIDQVFDEYEPKFNGDEIHSFEYVRKVLLSKYHEQKEGEGTDGRTIHKHRRGVGRPAKEGKSYEQILREAEAARKAWGG